MAAGKKSKVKWVQGGRDVPPPVTQRMGRRGIHGRRHRKIKTRSR